MEIQPQHAIFALKTNTFACGSDFVDLCIDEGRNNYNCPNTRDNIVSNDDGILRTQVLKGI